MLNTSISLDISDHLHRHLARYLATSKIFFLFNFAIIGSAIGFGIFLNGALPRKQVLWGRTIAQILIASDMLIFLGFINRENMLIEGFFFYLLMGIFAGATLHYFIAKLVGTFFASYVTPPTTPTARSTSPRSFL